MENQEIIEENKEFDPKNNTDGLERWLAKKAKLDEIDLVSIMDVIGADGNQDRIKNKYKFNGCNYILEGSKWLNGNYSKGGYGAVSLVLNLMEWEDEEKKDSKAMDWLNEHFPEVLDGDWSLSKKGLDEDEDNIKGFNPPRKYFDDETISAVKNYLINVRKIPSVLVEREINNGSLYATRKWVPEIKALSEPQCVFIGPSSAELRSVDPDGFKGCCAGSNPHDSCYQVLFAGNHENKIAMTEAAIDALSYHALNPSVFTVSTNGSGRFDLQYKLTVEAFNNGFKTDCAFDSDFAGDLAAQRIFNAIYLREYLSKEMGVPLDELDSLIISQKISSIPSQSSHEMFFNDLNKVDYPVSVKIKGKKGAEDVWQETLDRSQPTIQYSVLKNKFIPSGRFEVVLDKSIIMEILEKYGLERSRPKNAKDWNESWKRLGQDAIDAYNEKFSSYNINLEKKSSKNKSLKKKQSYSNPIKSTSINNNLNNSVSKNKDQELNQNLNEQKTDEQKTDYGVLNKQENKQDVNQENVIKQENVVSLKNRFSRNK